MARPTPSELKAWIRDDYDAAASGWETQMAPYFRVPAERLVDDLEPARGDRCLDLACGTGLIARAFAARAGTDRVAACDISSEQVDAARSALRAGGLDPVDVQVMDAERLRYPDLRFERIGCGFGVNHFPRPLTALREVRRVLVPGGRVGFTVWGPFSPAVRVRFDERLLELIPAIGAIAGSPVEMAFGRISERYGRPATLAGLMRQAGLVDVRQLSHRFAADYVDAPTFVDAMLSRAERDLRAARLDAADRAAVRAALVTELGAFPRSAFVVERTFHVLIGRRPPD